jgi:hypothetical protein
MFTTSAIIAAISTVWAFVTSALVKVYRGRISDLHDQIEYLRTELDKEHE